MFFIISNLVSSFGKNNDSEDNFPNKYDAYSKIKKCLKSCNSENSLKSCSKMIDNFRKMFDDRALLKELENMWELKFFSNNTQGVEEDH